MATASAVEAAADGARRMAAAQSHAAAARRALAAQSHAEVVENNASVVVLILLVLALVLGIYLYDRHWRRTQDRLEKVAGMKNQGHAFALNLVRHFMPSFKVDRYQFRGLRAKAGGANIEFEDLSLELPNGKQILERVTGRFEAGRMCAIMGPSGAGKTSFMNALCGKAAYGKMRGSIRVNGREANFAALRSVMGFVPQDDIVHQDLTVREQIHFSAKLRGSADWSDERIQCITDDVLNVMQIDHIQNSVVGSVERRVISGGQRKRVSIGLELAAEPTLLFLDEPTSGLDSTISLAVALSLKKLCQLGMTSIMVIHQPRYSLFELFDDVLLLAKGGQTIYLGPSLGVKPYFLELGFQMPSDENPADWFMDVISGEVSNPTIEDFKPEMLCACWRDSGSTQLKGLCNDLQDDVVKHQRSICLWDRAILLRRLETEWDRFDINNHGVMPADELQILLAKCSSMMPEPEIVRELMDRMAGEGAVVVTQRQFLDYLCSLHGDVAEDKTLAQLDEQGITGPDRKNAAGMSSCGSSGSFSRQVSELDATDELESGFAGSCSVASSQETLGRQMPGFYRQLRLLTLRRLVQWWRMNRQRAVFLGALALGSVVLAVLDTFIILTPAWDAVSLLNLHTTLALLLAIFCLQVFGNDQPLFWRESSSGLNTLAYFHSKLLVNGLDVFIQTVLFTSVYFIIRQPGISFAHFLAPFMFTAWAASGWGYLISTLVPPRLGPFVVSLVVFIICGLLGNPATLESFLEEWFMDDVVSVLSVTRWSVQMSFVYIFHDLGPVPSDVEMQAKLKLYEWLYLTHQLESLGLWHSAALALLLMGISLRIGSYFALCFRNRDKRI